MLINFCVFAGLDANRSEGERAQHMQMYSDAAPEMLMLFLRSSQVVIVGAQEKD